jgi:hypothetical protein
MISPDNEGWFAATVFYRIGTRLLFAAGCMLLASCAAFFPPTLEDTMKSLASAPRAVSAAVLYWDFTYDLRLYYWVQSIPLLTIPTVMVLFRSGYSHQWLLLVAIGWYAFAKFSESYDLAIFRSTRYVVSGHSIKHLMAGVSCYSILAMLERRRPAN